MKDPYYDARDGIQEDIVKLQGMREEWSKLFHSGNTAASDRFRDVHSEILGEAQQLESDLQEITNSISAVEDHPTRYNIDDSELLRRKDFVRKARTDISEIRGHLTSQATKLKIDEDQRQLLLSRKSKGEQHEVSRINHENEAFLGKQKQEQAQIIAQQDDQLEDLCQTAGRLADTALVIQGELKSQHHMLDKLGQDIDKESEKLHFVMKRIHKLMKTSDNKQLCLIVVLFITAAVLIFLIVNI